MVEVDAKGYDEASLPLPKGEKEQEDFAWGRAAAPVEPVEVTVELHRNAGKPP